MKQESIKIGELLFDTLGNLLSYERYIIERYKEEELTVVTDTYLQFFSLDGIVFEIVYRLEIKC